MKALIVLNMTERNEYNWLAEGFSSSSGRIFHWAF